MKFWITSFVLLFGLAELYQWVQHFTFPLPVFILGGAFLAIASNHDKRVGFPSQRPLRGTPSADVAQSLTPPAQPTPDAAQVFPAPSRSISLGVSTSPFDQYAAGTRSTEAEPSIGQTAQAPPLRSRSVSVDKSISFTIDPAKH
ncbi:hypothetical protein [Trichothermofontia sp.]